MSTPNASLASLLMVVERWQTCTRGDDLHPALNAIADLNAFNLDTLKVAAHQHAEALRAFARVADEIERPVLNPATSLRAAADFLEGEK